MVKKSLVNTRRLFAIMWRDDGGTVNGDSGGSSGNGSGCGGCDCCLL